MTQRTRRITRAHDLHRFVWIVLLALTLATGPGIARASEPGGAGEGADPAGGSHRVASPNPDTTLVPGSFERARALAGLAIQADETETPEADDETETPEDADDVAPTEEAAETFQDVLDQTADREPVFGPAEGELEHLPDSATLLSSGVDLQNFIAHVEFTNPYAASEGGWDIGFIFRLPEDGPHLRLIVTSTGTWALTPALEAPLDEGTVDGLNVRARQRNAIDLVVDGDVGYFGVNGEFIAELDLSEVDQSGDVAIATAFFVGNFQEGEATAYEDFLVWELPAAAVTPEPEDTETAEPEETETSEPEETETSEPEETETAEPEETETAEPEETQTAEPEETGAATTGETYVSPTYGYTVDYGADWSIDSEDTENGFDSVRFNNGVSTIDFIGYESDLTPEECIAGEQAFYESEPGYSDVEVALDENDNELIGEFDDPVFGDSAYGVFTFTYTAEGGDPIDYVAYVECRPLDPGTSLLRIVHFAPAGDYNDEIDARVELLEGVTFGAGPIETAEPEETVTAEPEETETPEPEETETAEPEETETTEPEETVTAEPEETETPTTGETYESPTYGYTLNLGEDWSAQDETSENGVDYVRLTNGVSTIDLFGYETDLSLEECVDGEIAYYEGEPAYSDIEPLLDEDDEEIRGENRDGAFAAVSFTYEDSSGDETDYVAYIECRDLEEAGTQLKIVQFVAPPDEFEDESDARDDLLDGLSLDGAGSEETPTEEPETPEPTEEPETPESTDGVVVALEPVGTADVTGLVTIEPDGDEVSVLVLAVGAEEGAVAVIQEGTCDDLPGEAAFELEDLRAGVSQSTVEASLEDLTGDDHAVTIHESADDLDDPLACGEIAA